MDQYKYQIIDELECYQRILNGIIAIDMGTAIVPSDDLKKWEDFIAALVRFQKENKENITSMIHEFGKDRENSSGQSPEDEIVRDRGKFLQDVKKLGFPVNILGPQALAMKREEPLEYRSMDMETNASRRVGKGKQEGLK